MILLTCLVPLLSPAQDELTAARDTYDEALSKIETESGRKLKTWPAQYTKALQSLQQKMQSSGDLDGWTTVNGELERFKSEKTIKKSNIVSEPAELASLQSSYREAVDKVSSEKNEGICRLVEVYVTRLETMKKSLTVGGKIDEALAVNAEIDRVKSSPAATEAEFAMAEYDASRGEVGTEEEGGGAPKEKVESSAIPEVDLPKNLSSLAKTGDADVNRSKVAPDLGLQFKKQTLRPTKVGRHKRWANVKAYLTDRKVSSRSVGRYSSRSSGTEYLVRLTLRTGKSTDVFDDVTVVVQYFAKSAAKGSGKITPRQLTVHCASIGQLDSNYVHVDFPGVSTHKYRYRYSRRYTYSAGDKFYGFVVSIFSGENKLLYQGTTASSLEDIGLGVMFEGAGAVGLADED
jgi:hypothetical protein